MARPIFQHLLLATERTEFDAGAERLALALARRNGQALAVVMPLAFNAEFEAVAPALAERADREAAAKLDRLRAQAREAGVEIDLAVRHGDEPCAEIVDDARERGADLIVIRRRGRRSFLAQLMVGEMVGKVVANAPCSVLIVPRDAALWQRRVLVAFEPDAQGQRLAALATALAAEAGIPLTAVCVLSSGMPRSVAEAQLGDLKRAAAGAGVQADIEVLEGAPAERILDAARRTGADLIVMGVRGLAHAGRVKVGRVAHEVAGRFDGALLLASSAPR
jgi:nucleotide-binding universal stress UspA family protein